MPSDDEVSFEPFKVECGSDNKSAVNCALGTNQVVNAKL